MKSSKLILLFLLIASLAMAQQKLPVYFIGEDYTDLSQTSNSAFYYQNLELKTDIVLEEAFAAAYYPDESILIVVTQNSEVYSFKKEGKKFITQNIKSLTEKERPLSVRFTTNSGLIYLHTSNLKIEQQIAAQPFMQMYSDRCYRIEISPKGENYYAIAYEKPNETLLLGKYYLANAKKIGMDFNSNSFYIELKEELAQPFKESPGDDLPEAIYVLKKKVIVCKTIKGWSLHNMDGSFIQFYSTQNITCDGWMSPIAENNNYYVVARKGPEAIKYRMDMESGQLTPLDVKN